MTNIEYRKLIEDILKRKMSINEGLGVLRKHKRTPIRLYSIGILINNKAQHRLSDQEIIMTIKRFVEYVMNVGGECKIYVV